MSMRRLLPLAAALLVSACATLPEDGARVAVPLFRDPVHDGAADPSIVRDPATGEWVMFYTNRRGDLTSADPKDVSWVHGTAIGVARSANGADWRYTGTAAIPAECTGATLWAPEVMRFGDRWHMWLTVVPGVFRDWNAPRSIVHLTSTDLQGWTCGERLELGSDRVIDADVVQLPGGRYRLFFNDERQNKAIRQADSTDLVNWTLGEKLVDTPGEGPVVWQSRGHWWMISDAWRGLLVMRSDDDGQTWQRQDGYLLGTPGTAATDRSPGHHPDVVVAGGRAWLFHFVQQDREAEMAGDPQWGRRSVIQLVELLEQDGRLTVTREPPLRADVEAAFTAR